MWQSVFVAAVTVAATTAIVAKLAMTISSGAPAQSDISGVTIKPEKWSAAITVGFGLLIMLGSMMLAWLTPLGWPSLVYVFPFSIGALLAAFMAPSLTSVHDVSWNESAIEGPSKTFGPTLGRTRTQIPWSSITKSGKIITSYWYIQSDNGERIYWSYLYKGCGQLAETLKQHCPELHLPSDML